MTNDLPETIELEDGLIARRVPSILDTWPDRFPYKYPPEEGTDTMTMLSIDDMITLAVQTLFQFHLDHPKTLVSRIYSDDMGAAVFITTDPETVKAIEAVIPKITVGRKVDGKVELPDFDFSKPEEPKQ